MTLQLQTRGRRRAASPRHLRSLSSADASRSLSIVLEDISVGRATFTSQLAFSATLQESAPLYRALGEFATEAAVQSALPTRSGFRTLAFKLSLVRPIHDLPQGVAEATGELVSSSPAVLRAVARIHDSHGNLRARATLVALPLEAAPSVVSVDLSTDCAGDGFGRPSATLPQPPPPAKRSPRQTPR